MDETKEQPSYYAIIPADVRYSDLTANAKLLYGEITALANKTGYCWANNTYFAGLYGVHKDTVSGWISQLAEAGFIIVENSEAGARQLRLPPTTKTPTPHGEKTVHNNTSNNTSNKILPNGKISEPTVTLEPEFAIKPNKTVSRSQFANNGVDGLTKLARQFGFVVTRYDRNTAQRLIKKHGYKETREQLKQSQLILDNEYAPQVHNLKELEEKWLHVTSYLKKNGTEGIPPDVMDKINRDVTSRAEVMKYTPEKTQWLIEQYKKQYLEEGIWG